ncbi:MAG: cadherin domain-containing protein [Allosphingosinicella sp.]
MTAVYHSLANSDFDQNWSNTNLITANDDWSLVPSIIGYKTGDVTTTIPVDARTVITDAGFVQNVFANQNPTNTTGGVIEVDRVTSGTVNPTIAMQGSNASDFEAIVINLDATGRKDVTFTANIRDLDASTDDAVQQVVVQYRVGGSGNWTNVAYFADVTTAGTATQVTAVNVVLPSAADNQSQVQVRILTTNAAGSDELIGIDDIHVTSSQGNVVIPDKPGAFSINDATVTEGNSGTTPITFTVSRGADSNVAAGVHYTVNLPGGATGASASDFASPTLSGDLNFAVGEFSKTITLNVAGDLVNEANETFTVTLSSPTNGASLSDASGDGLILNDDVPVGPGAPFINEIHYDNAGTDSGEAIEIAAPAGFNLTGWSLVLYNGSTGSSSGSPDAATVYGTKNLSGVVLDQDDGYGTISFTYPSNGIQNGDFDGVALVDPNGNVVQFISYEGAIKALNGPAAGMTSTDIGVSEDSGSPVGFSLQLAGSGASAADFHWVSSQANTFGAVNTGQDFVGPNATGLVSVGDASVSEGDSGVSLLTFTVTRAGGLGQAAGVDWFVSLPAGGANAADLGPGQPLSGHVNFAVGASSATVSIAVQGDTAGEGNETLNLLLANPTGNIAISDASAVGTILNDDPIALKIYEIQGEGHATAYAGQPVVTSGIVTGVVGNGFYLQDPTGDGNARTSDGIFVFTGSAPAVAVGDAVQVTGKPNEFVPGANSLSITELVPTAIAVQSHGNDLPAAVLIGVGGVLPPTSIMEDDGFTVFDPNSDGLDFYESMEGMRVTIDSPVVVSQTNSNGETWVLASGGMGATGYDGRGGITISPGDYNPERIQIDATPALYAGYSPDHSQGDRLSNVTGIMNYAFNSYEVLVTEAVTVTQDFTMPRETTTLDGDRDHLTIASYNVENFSPEDGPAKYNLLASNIVYNLSAPDIIALQEVQDANGLNGSDPLSGVETAKLLIDAIVALGGPHYVYVEIAPATANSTGGEPNGNIRPGFLYNPDRVSYIVGSAMIIDAPAFNGSRKPLVGDFTFNGETLRLIDVHLTSRLGSDSLEGANQPANDAGDAARTAQGQAVAAYVNSALATDPSLKLGVMGDFNGFYFEGAVGAIEATGLTDLHRLNPPEERYSYIFDGNLQAIDHMIVSGGLLSGAKFDVVHINAEQPVDTRATDHDPILGQFFIEHPNEAPFNLVLDGNSVDENQPAGTAVGTFSASDPDPEDAMTYSLTDNGGGLFAVDPVTGKLTTTAPLDHEAHASYDLVVRATDPHGAFVERTVTVTVGDVNEAPANLVIDDSSVDENAPAGTLVGTVSAGDVDGDALSYTLTDNAGGLFAVDPVTGALTTTAPLDHEAHSSYDLVVRATDPDGLFVEKTVTINVADVNEAPANLVIDDSSVDENAPAGTLVGTVSAGDVDGDTLAYTLVNDAGGRFALDAATGALSTTVALDHEAQASYDVVVRATDPGGLFVEKTITVAVADVNEAPTAVSDAVAVNEDATSANLWTQLLANDSDPDAGTTLSIASVNTAGTLGSLVFDQATQTLKYVADNDAFDALAPGQTVVDHFAYTVSDGHGLTSTATVNVTVTGIADGVSLSGGNGNDVLTGTGGEDTLSGGNGDDVLNGAGGHDILLGGNGADILDGGVGNDLLAGGNGNDLMTGGAGADSFRFGRGGGSDVITDFHVGIDQLLFEDGIGIASARTRDFNGDGVLDTNVVFTNGGGSVMLLGVSDFPGATLADLSNHGPVA